VETVLERALAVLPEERYVDVREMWEALRAALAAESSEDDIEVHWDDRDDRDSAPPSESAPWLSTTLPIELSRQRDASSASLLAALTLDGLGNVNMGE
jgi:hypothetical protein